MQSCICIGVVVRAVFAGVLFRSGTEQPLVGMWQGSLALMWLNDSSGNGGTGHSVRGSKLKSVDHGVSAMLKVTLGSKHTVVAWPAQWPEMIINIAREGLDGRAAWRRLFGHGASD